MPPDAGKANLPQTWIANAKADLAIARIDLPEDGMTSSYAFTRSKQRRRASKPFSCI